MISFRDISPTFTSQLYGISSLIANTLPGVCVPALQGALGTNNRSNIYIYYIKETAKREKDAKEIM